MKNGYVLVVALTGLATGYYFGSKSPRTQHVPPAKPQAEVMDPKYEMEMRLKCAKLAEEAAKKLSLGSMGGYVCHFNKKRNGMYMATTTSQHYPKDGRVFHQMLLIDLLDGTTVAHYAYNAVKENGATVDKPFFCQIGDQSSSMTKEQYVAFEKTYLED